MPLPPDPRASPAAAADFAQQPDKRRCTRISVDWRALVLRAGAEPLPVRVRDVAACGLRLECAQDFPLGAVLQLTVFMPLGDAPEQTLKLRARVCYQVYRADSIQAGVHFVDHTGARTPDALGGDCCNWA